MFQNLADSSCADRAPETVGAARRRRNRQLRAFLKHERMTVAKNLATIQHHSYMKSAVVDVGVQVGSPSAPVIEFMSSAPVTGYLAPAPAVQRHTVKQRIEHTPYVQILDAPVPLKVEQLVDFFKDLDIEVPAQVIEVPKISPDIIPQRSVDLVPQMVEQLVEVPTILTPTRIALRIAEQIVDIPASARGVFGSSQGSLPEQSSAQRTASQIADIPVPGLGGSSCLLGSLPEQRTTALHVAQERISERIELIDAAGDFPSRRAGPRVVRPRQGSAAAGAEQLADIVSSRGPHGFLPGQGSTASPGHDHVDEHLPESAEWVQSRDPTGKTYFWHRRTRVTQWKPPPGIRVVWVGEKPEGGRAWYWHKETRASTHDLPPLPPE